MLDKLYHFEIIIQINCKLITIISTVEWKTKKRWNFIIQLTNYYSDILFNSFITVDMNDCWYDKLNNFIDVLQSVYEQY